MVDIISGNQPPAGGDFQASGPSESLLVLRLGLVSLEGQLGHSLFDPGKESESDDIIVDELVDIKDSISHLSPAEKEQFKGAIHEFDQMYNACISGKSESESEDYVDCNKEAMLKTTTNLIEQFKG